MGYIRLAIIVAILTAVSGTGLYISSVISDNKKLELIVADQGASIGVLKAVGEKHMQSQVLVTDLNIKVARLRRRNNGLEKKLSKERLTNVSNEVLTRAINIGTGRMQRALNKVTTDSSQLSKPTGIK